MFKRNATTKASAIAAPAKKTAAEPAIAATAKIVAAPVKAQAAPAKAAFAAAKPAMPPVVSPAWNSMASRGEARGAANKVTQDMIARRAYEISQSGQCGSDTENWLRAEQDLRSQPSI